MQSEDIDIQIPRLAGEFLSNLTRHNVLYGGRGSGKSVSVARYLVWLCQISRQKVLCCRETMASLDESVKAEIENAIDELDLGHRYLVGQRTIRSVTGSEFLFRGLGIHANRIRSLSGVTVCWIEEAHDITNKSLGILLPTVRKKGSKIIYTMNPVTPDDAVYRRFIEKADGDPDINCVKMNFDDNPWFDEPLLSDLVRDRERDFAEYRHTWLGEFWIDEDARIFKRARREAFETPPGVDHIVGLDFGYSPDPFAAVRTFMSEDQNTIYIDWEAGGTGHTIDQYGEVLREIPGADDHLIIADSAQPEQIAYLKKNENFRVAGAMKGQGSIREGIEFLQSKDLVIHPRCPRTWAEFSTIKWARHKVYDCIIPGKVDETCDDHFVDATRYAWEGGWKRRGIRLPSRYYEDDDQ